MTMTTKRAAARLALFLGAATGALALTAGAAEAQLSANLVGSAAACSSNGAAILAEGAPICSAEMRLRTSEVRLGIGTARDLPRGANNSIAFNPRNEPGCVNANALPPDPVTYNCERTLAQDPLYSQCVVELSVETGAGGRQVNEAACLLRRAITFQLRDLADVVQWRESVSVVECLAYDRPNAANRAPTDDPVLGEPVNVCTVDGGVRLRDRAARRSPLRNAESGWKVRIQQNTADLPAGSVTSPFTRALGESLF